MASELEWRALVRDLRQASNTVRAAAEHGVEEGVFDAEDAEEDFALAGRLRQHARHVEAFIGEPCRWPSHDQTSDYYGPPWEDGSRSRGNALRTRTDPVDNSTNGERR